MVTSVHKKFSFLFLAGSLVLGLGSRQLAGSETDDGPPEKPMNVVFVLVDDLGWTDLGCYGSRFYDTPNVDGLAAEGIRFTQAYAASPVCSPTRAALMTGQHPVRLNITDWITGHQEKDPLLETPEDRHELPLEELTIAEIFREEGYATAYVGKWHLGETAEFWPENQGFDVNIGGFSKGSPPGGYYSPYRNPRLEDGPEGEYLTNRLTDEAIGFVREHRNDPFLLYLAFYTVHAPIEGCDKWDAYYAEKREELPLEMPEEVRAEGSAVTRLHQSDARYAAMVRSMDENVGRLLAELETLGLRENTLVVFTSDNGGLSTRRNKAGPTSVLPLRAGKGWCYEGGIRIPLIIRAPGLAQQGSVSDQATISMDLLPTVLDIAGLPARPERHRDGISLLPAISQPVRVEPRTLFWHYPHYHSTGWTPGSAIRMGDWKLVRKYESGSLELYQLANDPAEENDLALEYPEMVTRMSQYLDTFCAEMEARLPRPLETRN